MNPGVRSDAPVRNGLHCCATPKVQRFRKCPHLQAYKDKGGLVTFQAVERYLHSAHYRVVSPLPTVRCTTNGCRSRRLYACLSCLFIGCGPDDKHLTAHFNETGHVLAVDCVHHCIYCRCCKDVVWDSDFSRLAALERTRAFHLSLWMRENGNAVLPPPTTASAVVNGKRAHAEIIDLEEPPLMKRTPPLTEHMLGLIASRTLTPPQRLGVRGLTNLGATCFMNSILQAYLHNPTLRNYFFGPRFCCQSTTGCDLSCLECELAALFCEVFSGQTSPFPPHRLLYTIWRSASHFAGYVQQDAHEFLITALNLLHTHSHGKSSSTGCSCVAHAGFEGLLRSDLTCMRCSKASTVLEPFFDISLGLASTSEEPLQLLECLLRFTSPESLGSSQKIFCERCNSPQESQKQLSFRQLPPTLVIHFKRFEHRAGKKGVKLDDFVSFPEVLDMSPFLDAQPGPPRPSIYRLSAVIHHHGSLDQGHYISYVRQSYGRERPRVEECILQQQQLVKASSPPPVPVAPATQPATAPVELPSQRDTITSAPMSLPVPSFLPAATAPAAPRLIPLLPTLRSAQGTPAPPPPTAVPSTAGPALRPPSPAAGSSKPGRPGSPAAGTAKGSPATRSAVASGRMLRSSGATTPTPREQGSIWLRCDDSTITLSSREEVLATKAYLLFYVREDAASGKSPG